MVIFYDNFSLQLLKLKGLKRLNRVLIEMEGTDHVKTAIRWRSQTDCRGKAVEKLGENVNFREHQYFLLFF